MVWLATALAVTFPQATEQPPSVGSDAQSRDEIVLEGGEKIIGKITKLAGNYIEVRLDENTVVGFDRSRIIRILRGGASAAAVVSARLTARDGWYLLHGGDGRTLGYLHGLVQVTKTGDVQLTEEWFFGGNKGSTRVTVVEIVDSDLRPRSCFYHERVSDKSGRLVAESLRRGTVEGASLLVDWRSLRGREKQKYPFKPGARFPLAFREEIRQSQGVAIHAANRQVFDVKTGQFKNLQASSVQRRKVAIDKRIVAVREVSIEDGSRKNREWIDGNSQVLRREINGPALVAVRTTREQALRTESNYTLRGFSTAIARSADGQIGVWLPNPIWSVKAAETGSVTVEAPLFAASATLIELSHIEKNVQLASVADDVLRWLRLSVGRKLKVIERTDVRVRRLPAVKLKLRWQAERVGESVAFWGTCHVFRFQDRCLAFFHAAPRANFHVLQDDVARILDSVQLMTEDFAPPSQGTAAKPGR